jgi:hypothetical protein
MKKPKMFTTKGMIQLPFALLLRTPLFIISYTLDFIGRGFTWCGDMVWKLLDIMPSAEINPQYYKYRKAEAKRKALEEYLSNAQQG